MAYNTLNEFLIKIAQLMLRPAALLQVLLDDVGTESDPALGRGRRRRSRILCTQIRRASRLVTVLLLLLLCLLARALTVVWLLCCRRFLCGALLQARPQLGARHKPGLIHHLRIGLDGQTVEAHILVLHKWIDVRRVGPHHRWRQGAQIIFRRIPERRRHIGHGTAVAGRRYAHMRYPLIPGRSRLVVATRRV